MYHIDRLERFFSFCTSSLRIPNISKVHCDFIHCDFLALAILFIHWVWASKDVPLFHFTSLGHGSALYLHDSYHQRGTYETCLKGVFDIIKLLRELGFLILAQKNQYRLQFHDIY